MSEKEVVEALEILGAVVLGDDFANWSRQFCMEHCDAFEFDDENRFSYTDIHNSYMEEAEKKLVEGLPKSFDMDGFMPKLVAFMENQKEGNEETGSNENVLAAINTLSSLTDFSAFKDIMLLTKGEKMNAGMEQVTHMEVKKTSATGEELPYFDMINEYSSSPNDKWKRTLDKPNLIVEKMALENEKKGTMLMRVSYRATLSMDECTACMMDYSPERAKWDKMYKSSVTHKSEMHEGTNIPKDHILEMTFKMPAMMKVSGIPNKFDLRIMTKRDFPEKGALSWAMVPWDLKTNTVDANNKWLKGNMGTMKPHPENPDEVALTMLEQNSVSWMPNFAMNYFVKSQLIGLVERYKKYKKKGKK